MIIRHPQHAVNSVDKCVKVMIELDGVDMIVKRLQILCDVCTYLIYR